MVKTIKNTMDVKKQSLLSATKKYCQTNPGKVRGEPLDLQLRPIKLGDFRALLSGAFPGQVRLAA